MSNNSKPSKFTFALFNKVFLPISAVTRRCYSAIIYGVLYLFVFRKHLNDADPTKFADLKNLAVPTFNVILANEYWIPEKGNGALDFTYRNPEFFLIPAVYKKWGRDCDDFSHVSFTFMKLQKFAEVYQVLTTTLSRKTIFKHSHLITIGRKLNSGEYTVYNNSTITHLKADSIEEAMVSAVKLANKDREGYENAIQCIYRKFTS